MLQQRKVFFVLLIVLLGALGNIYYNYSKEKKLADQRCDLANGSCRVNLHNKGVVRFSAASRPMGKSEVALSMSLQLTHLSAKKAEVLFASDGPDALKRNDTQMQRFSLQPASQGLFSGAGTLKVAPGAQRWTAMVLIDTAAGQQYAVPFELTLQNP